MGKAVGILAAVVASASSIAAIGLIAFKVTSSSESGESLSPVFPPPVMYSKEFPPEALSEEKLSSLYGPLNSGALEEEKQGILSKLANRIKTRKQKSWKYSQAALRQPSQASLQSCKPSSQLLKPSSGSSQQSTQHSHPAQTPISSKQEAPEPVLIEVL